MKMMTISNCKKFTTATKIYLGLTVTLLCLYSACNAQPGGNNQYGMILICNYMTPTIIIVVVVKKYNHVSIVNQQNNKALK